METNTEKGLDKKIAGSYQDIPGWGIDADPENDPTYPMKHYTGADHQRLKYDRAPQQRETVEVLHSIERPGITRVFGTTVPPSGVSGAIRRVAFRFSEGTAAHWLGLLIADRVNVVEGIVDDLAHGHVPDFFSERGWKAEWKYNRAGAVRSLAVGALVTSAVIGYLVLKSKTKRTTQMERSIPL